VTPIENNKQLQAINSIQWNVVTPVIKLKTTESIKNDARTGDNNKKRPRYILYHWRVRSDYRRSRFHPREVQGPWASFQGQLLMTSVNRQRWKQYHIKLDDDDETVWHINTSSIIFHNSRASACMAGRYFTFGLIHFTSVSARWRLYRRSFTD